MRPQEPYESLLGAVILEPEHDVLDGPPRYRTRRELIPSQPSPLRGWKEPGAHQSVIMGLPNTAAAPALVARALSLEAA